MSNSSVMVFGFMVLWFLLSAQNVMSYDDNWLNNGADSTFYGAWLGDGSNGGSCGYETLSTSAYGSSIFAGSPPLYNKEGSPPLYNKDAGCGACYQVKCTVAGLCNADGVKVVQTDSCPGCPGTRFDLSGTAFNALATPGNGEKLKTLGRLDVQYKRVPCTYNTKMAFKVGKGSNAFSLDIIVKYVGGYGDVSAVSVLQAGTTNWIPAIHDWGVHWRVSFPAGLKGALSVQVTSATDKRTLIATDVLPANWQSDQEFVSNVQF